MKYYKKVQVDKDQKKAKSEKDSYSKNRGEKQTSYKLPYRNLLSLQLIRHNCYIVQQIPISLPVMTPVD